MTKNEMKCGIICEKIAIRVDDEKRMINYEWPKVKPTNFMNHISKFAFYI